jgi:hypothetical protein
MMGASYKTKKELKAAIGQRPRLIETSVFGPEYRDNGRITVVGPSPYERKWYATITMKDGLIARVE